MASDVRSAPFVFDCHCWISAALGGRDTQLIRDVTLLQSLSLSLSLPRIWTPNRPSKPRDSPMELIFSRCRYFGNQVHKLQGEGPHDHSDVGYCAHYLACGFDALASRCSPCFVLRSILCGSGPLQAGQFVPCPGQRCSLKARRFSEFRILPNPTISVLTPFSQVSYGTFLPRSSLKINRGVPPP